MAVTNALPRRRLGTDGPLVSAIGFGGAVLSPGYYEPVEDAGCIATLQYAIDAGIDLIDTSDVYGAGHNEELIGRAIAGRRDRVFIASKFGWVIDGSPGREVRVNYDMPGIRANGRPEYMRQRIEASLKRLAVDYLDIYYNHFPDPGTPIEETVGGMAALVQEGKVRYLGLCNIDAERLRRAHAVHPIAAVENEYSLWARTPEREVLPATQAWGIGFVPWAPLGSGFLSADIASVEDYRAGQPRFKPHNLRENRTRFAPLRGLAQELGMAPAQLALAWLLHQGAQVVPVPGMTQRWQVDENLAATRVVLDAQALARIQALAPPGLAVGDELL